MNNADKSIINDYRELHKIPETGFDLEKTTAYIKKRLNDIGIECKDIGKNGIYATFGSGEKCVLLRADTDALPIREETGLEYTATNGNMHACAHDAHTAMLLSAAKCLKARENELKCTVKLLFQPAEEILCGALNMIENGILENPTVNAAVMLHAVVGTELESGSLIVSSEGVSAPSVDYFRITLFGKGTHGAMPENGRDPIALACRITLALEELKAKELAMGEKATLTVCRVAGGAMANVIPDTAFVEGSLRAFKTETREYLKNRIKAIVNGLSLAFECKSELDFYSGAPALVNDGRLSDLALECAKRTVGESRAFTSKYMAELAEKNGNKSAGTGSEDFAYISEKVPSVMLAVAMGKYSDGFVYPLHHPRFRIDENALACGSAFFTEFALSYNV